MSIEGLYVRPEATVPEFRQGQPDVGEAVEVTIEAHRLLGFTPDVDQVTKPLTDAFKERAGMGYDGRLYVDPPKIVKSDAITAAAEGKRPENVEGVWYYKNLWVPGTEPDSYTTEELDAAPEEGEARLALFNPNETDVDLILQFLNLPFDDRHRGDAPQTQQEAFEAAKAGFERYHKETALYPLGHRAVRMFTLMDRIRGVDTEAENFVDPQSDDFILNRGFARDLELGRRAVDGDSCVGDVDSLGGRSGFDRSYGYADWSGGVGVSVGSKAPESQAP